MVNHPKRSRFAGCAATYFVQRDGCDIDRFSRERGSYVPEARKAKFPALEEACAWIDHHFPLRTPSLFDQETDSIDLTAKYAARAQDPDLTATTGEMVLWFKANWAADFDFVVRECPNNSQQEFIYARTRRGWAVLSENGWTLLGANVA